MGATRQRILEAAITAARRDGHRRSSVEEIAHAAGITRQALYRHFPTKDDLFRASAALLHERALAAAAAQTSKGVGMDAIFATLHARYDYIIATIEGTHAQELIEESSRLCPDISDRSVRRFEALLCDAVEAQRRAGRLALRPGLTPRTLAQTLMAAARGVKSAHPAPSRRQFKTALRRIVDLILAGAASEPRLRR
ncbi:MAG: TetR family transcriptional regulator [Alphaproteobacteria bacterium]|nr:TetR family transcriptional regulator [Alphaproteobacteria bacterium]